MARTIDEIYQSMISAKQTKSSLDNLNASSAYAVYKLLFYVCAVGISSLEQIFDIFKADIEDIKLKAAPQTERWWNDKMLNYYQYDNTSTDKGVLIVEEDLIPKYKIIDPSKRIIKYVATKQSENSRQVNIKVSKDNGSNAPAQLSLDELNSAKSFVDTIQSAGLLINVISFPADKLKLDINIYYNGQYVQTNVLADVKDAIKEYLKTLKFDGTIELIRLIDRIQKVEGVSDVLINTASGKEDGGGYQSFNRVYNTKSGYAELNETDSVFNMILQNN